MLQNAIFSAVFRICIRNVYKLDSNQIIYKYIRYSDIGQQYGVTVIPQHGGTVCTQQGVYYDYDDTSNFYYINIMKLSFIGDAVISPEEWKDCEKPCHGYV